MTAQFIRYIKHPVLSNTVYQLIGKVLSMSITILATVIVTRFYGKSGYGEFSLMQTWPALFFVIVDFGLNAIATRELSKNFSYAKKYLGNILFLRILFSVFLMAVLFVAVSFFPYSESLIFGIRLSLLLILTQSLFTTVNIIFQVKLRYDLSTIGYVLGYVLILALVLVFSFYKVEIAWVSFSYVVGGLATFFINYLFIKKLGILIDFKFDPVLCKSLLYTAFPLGLMFVFSQINFKADAILMSVLPVPKFLSLTNIETVGIYALPYKIFEVSLVIPTFFMNSVYPILVVKMTKSKKELKTAFFKAVLFLGLSAVLCSLVGIALSPLAISLLGGPQFSQSVLVLQILIAGLILYYLTQPIAWLIVTLDGQKYLPWVYLASAIFNVTANYLFIPQYSFYASSVITHVSEFINLLLLVFFAVLVWKKKYA